MPDNTEFEQALSSLATGKLVDTAPGLMPYLVGFEIVERDEDEPDSRAVAVCGFKVDDKWLYVPVFFINGAIRGMDMIYSRSADLFTPLKDSWVAYILSKTPTKLGKKDEDPEQEHNISTPDFMTAYSGDALYGASGFKSAGANLDTLWSSIKTACAGTVDLVRVSRAAPSVGLTLLKTAAVRPQFKEALLRHYALAELFGDTGGLNKAAADLQPKLRDKRGSFSDYVREQGWKWQESVGTVFKVDMNTLDLHKSALAEDDVTALYRGEVRYIDTRPKASFVFCKEAKASDESTLTGEGDNTPKPLEEYQVVTQGPSESGHYRVVMRDGNLQRLYVATQVRPILQPRVPHWRSRYEHRDTVISGGGDISLVLDPSSGVGAHFPANAVVTVGSSRLSEGKDTPSAHPLSSMKEKHRYCLLFPDGSLSSIFRYEGKETTDGTGSYYIRPERTVMKGGLESTDQPELDFAVDSAYNWQGKDANLDDCGVIIQRDDVGDTSSTATMRVVGPDVKVINVGQRTGDHDTLDGAPQLGSGEVLWNLLLRGDATTKEFALAKTAGAYRIKLGEVESILRPTEVHDTLIMRVGLREKQARDLVQAADLFGEVVGGVKLAAQVPDDVTAPIPQLNSAGYSDMFGRPAETPQTGMATVSSLEGGADPTRAGIRDDPEVLQIMQAAQTGKKDLFDVSVLRGVAKTIDVSSLIDDYLPDLIRGLDRIGRVRLLFYWHLPKFEERYGHQDVIQLDDSLKNVFSALGDAILFLQRKTSDGDPSVLSLDAGLGDIA